MRRRTLYGARPRGSERWDSLLLTSKRTNSSIVDALPYLIQGFVLPAHMRRPRPSPPSAAIDALSPQRLPVTDNKQPTLKELSQPMLSVSVPSPMERSIAQTSKPKQPSVSSSGPTARWSCPYCSHSNASGSSRCSHCAAQRVDRFRGYWLCAASGCGQINPRRDISCSSCEAPFKGTSDWVCTKKECRTENLRLVVFCRECKSPQEPTWNCDSCGATQSVFGSAECTQCKAVTTARMPAADRRLAQCSHCGSKVLPTSLSCHVCGGSQLSSPVANVHVSSKVISASESLQRSLSTSPPDGVSAQSGSDMTAEVPWEGESVAGSADVGYHPEAVPQQRATPEGRGLGAVSPVAVGEGEASASPILMSTPSANSSFVGGEEAAKVGGRPLLTSREEAVQTPFSVPQGLPAATEKATQPDPSRERAQPPAKEAEDSKASSTWACTRCMAHISLSSEVCTACGAERAAPLFKARVEAGRWACQAHGHMNPFHSLKCLKCEEKRVVYLSNCPHCNARSPEFGAECYACKKPVAPTTTCGACGRQSTVNDQGTCIFCSKQYCSDIGPHMCWQCGKKGTAAVCGGCGKYGTQQLWLCDSPCERPNPMPCSSCNLCGTRRRRNALLVPSWWECRSCGSPNNAIHPTCSVCEGPRSFGEHTTVTCPTCRQKTKWGTSQACTVCGATLYRGALPLSPKEKTRAVASDDAVIKSLLTGERKQTPASKQVDRDPRVSAQQEIKRPKTGKQAPSRNKLSGVSKFATAAASGPRKLPSNGKRVCALCSNVCDAGTKDCFKCGMPLD